MRRYGNRIENAPGFLTQLQIYLFFAIIINTAKKKNSSEKAT